MVYIYIYDGSDNEGGIALILSRSRVMLSLFYAPTCNFSAALLKGIVGGTRDTRNYTGSGRSPTPSVEICELMFFGSSVPKGLQWSMQARVLLIEGSR
jgi:hypothetical protein